MAPLFKSLAFEVKQDAALSKEKKSLAPGPEYRKQVHSVVATDHSWKQLQQELGSSKVTTNVAAQEVVRKYLEEQRKRQMQQMQERNARENTEKKGPTDHCHRRRRSRRRSSATVGIDDLNFFTRLGMSSPSSSDIIMEEEENPTWSLLDSATELLMSNLKDETEGKLHYDRSSSLLLAHIAERRS